MFLFSYCCFTNSSIRASFGKWIGRQWSGSSHTTNYFKIISRWNVLATACTWALFFLQQKKAGGSLNHCSSYLKEVFQLGAKKRFFSKALKNHNRSPAAYKNFPLPSYSQSRIESFSVFSLILSSWTCTLSCQMNLWLIIHFFSFLLVLSDIYSLGPFWLFLFFTTYIHLQSRFIRYIISQSLLFLLSIIL